MIQTKQKDYEYNTICKLMEMEPITNEISISSYSDKVHLAESERNQRLTAALQVFINMVAGKESEVEIVDKVLIDSFIAEIDAALSRQLDTILHHEKFQRLEASWKNLEYLVNKVDFQSNIQVNLIDVNKEGLQEDFDDASEIIQSGLYKHVYEQEYDTPGGKPVSVIVSDYLFDASPKDIGLLSDIAKVAASAHCPFLACAGPKFFGKTSMEEVAKINDIQDYMERAEYIRWNNFRDNEDARYIGLVMPQFLLRLPYGNLNPVKKFSYSENVNDNHKSFLWGAATFAFASNLARSFKLHGWAVGIRGPESGGKIDNLTLHQYDLGGGLETMIPTEIIIPETRELELANLGFIPLSYYKNSNYACFFSANSVHRAPTYSDPDATANSRINARLPYIFLASRLGHYLKVLQRENIGSTVDKAVLEQALSKWLNTLITQTPNPGPELVAKRPLRDGKIVVHTIPENPGFYKIDLYAIPHFQVEGIDVKLSLVAQMPVMSNK